MVVLIKYMDDHPQELNTTTVEVALNALMKAYPAK